MDYAPDRLEAHPIALLFPPLSPDQSRELANDIRQKGLLHDIWLYEDTLNGGTKSFYILDGRSRNEACVIEGVEPRYQVYTGADPLGFAVSLNERRRHMSMADRRTLAKNILAYNPAITDRELGRKASIAHGTAADVRREAAPSPANGENVHKDSEGPGSSPEQAPQATEEGVPTSPPAPPAPEPTPRVEAGGRRARGRKPSKEPKLAAKAKKEVKPKSVLGNPRDVWVASSEQQFKENPTHALTDIVMIVKSYEGKIREKISEQTRRELAVRFAAALGFVIPYPV